ncbi:hypothetical protein [Pseudofulvibacter geojedonensis]|uniref:Uncharacterized protein n=1 Tax=Pseudofulvibacter geojedonensis TaxID=1123758 RepID=A0ABW3I0W9_9FLAO
MFIKNTKNVTDKLNDVSLILKEDKIDLPKIVFNEKLYKKYLFYDFDYIFSEFFYEDIISYLKATNQKSFVFICLEPQEDECVFEHFESYNLIEFPVDLSFNEYIYNLNYGVNNDISNAVIHRGQKFLIYSEKKDLVFFANRKFEMGVFGYDQNQIDEKNIKVFIDNFMSAEEFLTESLTFYSNLDNIRDEFIEFLYSVRTNYGKD